MESARLLGACALIEVARVLVQKRWQDGAADHDVGNAAGVGSAKALSVTLRTLAVVGDISCLVDAGDCGCPEDRNRIKQNFGGELELQLRRERSSVAIIDDVEIGDEAENALLLLDLVRRSPRGKQPQKPWKSLMRKGRPAARTEATSLHSPMIDKNLLYGGFPATN
jgi:hypothetical protein